MKRIFLFAVLAAGVYAVSITACKKPEADTETTSATDNSLCEGEFNRVVPATNSIAIGDPGVNGNRQLPQIASQCPVDSIDPADTLDGYPVTMYINYGTSCVCPDGKIRAGTLKCVFDTAWDSSNPTLTIYLLNYYVNNIHFEGTIAVSKNTAARTFTQVITGGKCSNSSWEILYNGTHTLTMTAGFNTLTDPTDDIFTIGGDANGTNRDGLNFTVNITSPIEKRGNCRYITKGTFEITPEGKNVRTVDFGDGTCDDQATLKIKNSTFSFTLQ